MGRRERGGGWEERKDMYTCCRKIPKKEGQAAAEFEEFNESVDFAGGNMIHTLTLVELHQFKYLPYIGDTQRTA